jgi:phosphatidylserine synthase
MNLPNAITLSRIPMMFIIVWLMYCTWPGAATLAFVLFVAAAVGDWLDGYLARTRGLGLQLRQADGRHGRQDHGDGHRDRAGRQA